MKAYNLYLIITEEHSKGRSALEIAAAAIAGGVDIIQMREKNKTAPELIDLGKKLSNLCKQNRVTFIVNDDPVLAKEVDADGVHLGQDDILKVSVNEARAMLGPGKIIGLSTESCYQAESANKEDIDYIGYGPVFRTTVKDKCVGTKDVGRILEMSKRPVVFIGGITLSNVDELLSKGARNISLIRAITEADDVTLAARSFRSKLDDARRGSTKSGKTAKTRQDTSGIF